MTSHDATAHPAPMRPAADYLYRPAAPRGRAGGLIARQACPACLGTSWSVLYEEPYAGPGVQAYLERHYEGRAGGLPADAIYRLSRCHGCGLVFQAFAPDEELLDTVYNEWIPGSSLDRTVRDYSLEEYRYLHEQVEFIVQHFGVPPSRLRLLDFGFGWAHWARMAMAFGCRVAGVELSEERKAFGRSVGIEVLELDSLPAEAFDFVHTEQVFEHLVEPHAVLQVLARALKPGGLLKISVPDAAASLRLLAAGEPFGRLPPALQMPVAPLEHLNAFTYDSVVAFARSVGLQPLRPRLTHLYNGASGLLNTRRLLKVLARPIYRHYLHRGAFVYFTRPPAR